MWGKNNLTRPKNQHNTVMEALINYISDTLTPINLRNEYDLYLDDEFEFPSGPFQSMYPSDVLKTMDEIKYNLGCREFINDKAENEWLEIDSLYYAREDVEQAREDFILELKIEVKERKEEVNSMIADKYPQEDIDEAAKKLLEVENQIKEAKKYIF